MVKQKMVFIKETSTILLNNLLWLPGLQITANLALCSTVLNWHIKTLNNFYVP